MAKGGDNGGLGVRNKMDVNDEVKGEIGARDMANISSEVRTDKKVRGIVKVVSIRNTDQKFHLNNKIKALEEDNIINKHETILLDKTDFMLSILSPYFIGERTKLRRLLSNAMNIRIKDKKTFMLILWMAIKQISPKVWNKNELELYNSLVRKVARRLKRQLDKDEHIIIIVDPYLDIMIKYIKTDNIEAVKELLNMLEV